MTQRAWLVVYALVLLAHYPGLVYLFYSPIPNHLGIKRDWAKVCLWFGTWLGAGLLFNGCIFSYAEQYCLVRAGEMSEITYRLQDSLAYKLVWRFF